MGLTYNEVAALLRPSPSWNDLDDLSFELEVWSLDRAIRELRPVWDNTPLTFEFFDGQVTRDKKTLNLIENFDTSRPTLLLAVRSGSITTVRDGNHHMAALAARRGKGIKDDIVIGVVVGQR